jgi:hypothetical protein
VLKEMIKNVLITMKQVIAKVVKKVISLIRMATDVNQYCKRILQNAIMILNLINMLF